MLADILNSNSVLRLREIIRARYGLGLKVQFLTNATSLDLNMQSPSVTEGDLRIPVIARGKYLATATVEKAEALSDQDHIMISEMVRLVLEPALFSWYLKRNESNVMQLDSITELPTIGNLRAIEDIRAFDNDEDLKPAFSSSVLLLESKNPHVIPRVAVQIHEIGERWAYLRYQDVKSQVNSIDDLKEMGSMTLLVDDILSLSSSEQALLAEYSMEADTQSEPLILIGCTTPFSELVAKEMVHPNLVAPLQLHRLDLDRMPKEFGLLKEALELILDRKSLLN